MLAVNDATSLLAALSAGIGKSVLPACVADNRTDLEPIALDDAPPQREIWMLTHPDLRDTARHRVFRDFIADLFARRREKLGGSPA